MQTHKLGPAPKACQIHTQAKFRLGIESVISGKLFSALVCRAVLACPSAVPHTQGSRFRHNRGNEVCTLSHLQCWGRGWRWSWPHRRSSQQTAGPCPCWCSGVPHWKVPYNRHKFNQTPTHMCAPSQHSRAHNYIPTSMWEVWHMEVLPYCCQRNYRAVVSHTAVNTEMKALL